MRPLNPAAWNIIKPLSLGALALAACTPAGADDDAGTTTTQGNDTSTTSYSTTYTSYTTVYTTYSSYTTYSDYSSDNWDDYYDPCNYCAPDELCNNGECYLPGCEDNLDCSDGLACIDHICTQVPQSLVCGTWPTLGIDIPPLDDVLDMQFVDVDNDGAQELVMLTLTGVSVFDDDLSVTDTAWIEPGQFTQMIAMRVDSDDFVDLAFTDPDSGALRTLLSNGDGSFGGELSEVLEQVTDGFGLDLDLDGEDELVGLINGMPASIEGVGEAGVVVSLTPTEAHQRVHHGDNDGDGRQDLLLAGLASDMLAQTASWVLQQGGGGWSPANPALGLALDQPQQWGAFDLDGDGLDDAFSAAPSLGVVFMQTWSGGKLAASTVPEEELGWIVGAEFDGTNGEEVLLGTAAPRLVQRLNADPLGCNYPLEGVPAGGTHAVAGDFDGDGIDEIAVLVDGVVQLRVSDS
ncbi:hypothetical protein DB30_03908 [Enhygromyxa salina]|uniref:FG-GAP repeat protein n=1 Tax=Enhygromyxa salina TaxID=215803 RepID=A0A0C2DI47_9BACT|nr:EB domain-containing protein [Enhygromyxa salina]KIG19352.1 hypothetical protein DB30_03908 [Enhygromyxa salina]